MKCRDLFPIYHRLSGPTRTSLNEFSTFLFCSVCIRAQCTVISFSQFSSLTSNASFASRRRFRFEQQLEASLRYLCLCLLYIIQRSKAGLPIILNECIKFEHSNYGYFRLPRRLLQFSSFVVMTFPHKRKWK